MNNSQVKRGRGSVDNPPNRFHRLHVEPDLSDVPPEERTDPETQYLRMSSKTILTKNDSPDVGFNWSINPYAGCSHGWRTFTFYVVAASRGRRQPGASQIMPNTLTCSARTMLPAVVAQPAFTCLVRHRARTYYF